jgi:hypothetical protein
METLRSRSPTGARIGFVLLVTAIVTAAMPGEVAAKHRKHAAHHHVVSKRTQNARAALYPQTTSFGSMRYYGGPKSPMWREAK